MVGRKLECTSEPGGGSSPVSDRALGSACRNRGHRFVLSSSMMGNCPAFQRMMREDRPGSMGRRGLQWDPRRGCIVREEKTLMELGGSQRGWWDFASLALKNSKGSSRVLGKCRKFTGRQFSSLCQK